MFWSLGYFGVSGSLKSGLIGDPRSELSDQVNRWNAEGGKESSGDDLSQTRDRADGEGSSAQMNGFVTRLTDSEAITNGWYARCDAERLRRRRVEVRERVREGGESKKERRLDGVRKRGERIGGRLVGAGEGFPEKPEECHFYETTTSKRRRGGNGAGDR